MCFNVKLAQYGVFKAVNYKIVVSINDNACWNHKSTLEVSHFHL